MNRIWKKLFTKNTAAEEVNLHVAGATVRHRNPFEDLEVPRNENGLAKETIGKWVVPFYMTDLSNLDEKTTILFANASKKIDQKTVSVLLADFDWRSRIAGAIFAAINNYHELEEVIGRHLLKSEVCYAGSGYCLALTVFSSKSAKDFLTTYLEFYLERKDLWFDQADAFCALEYLDKDMATRLLPKWIDFVSDKPYWNLERSREHFLKCLESFSKIRSVSDQNSW